MHKQIRLPVLIDAADELAEERHVVRAYGPAKEFHLGLVGRLTALHVIAPEARAHEVFPRVLAAAALRNDVIDGERDARRATILALVSITSKNILAR